MNAKLMACDAEKKCAAFKLHVELEMVLFSLLVSKF
jgi:hypothetical protein